MNKNYYLGMALMISAAAAFAVGDIGLKVYSRDLTVWQIACGRAVVGLAGTLILARFFGRNILGVNRPWLVVLGVLSTSIFLGLASSMKHLPLSVAMALFYLYPAFGALFSYFINKEKPSRLDWLAVAVAITGAFIITRNLPMNHEISLGLIFVVLAAAGLGVLINLIRMQIKNNPPYVLYFYVCCASLVMALPMILFFQTAPAIPTSSALWGLFVWIAPWVLVGQLLTGQGYKYLPVAKGAVLQTLELVFAGLYGVLALNEALSPQMLGGGGLVFLSAVIIARQKQSGADSSSPKG